MQKRTMFVGFGLLCLPLAGCGDVLLPPASETGAASTGSTGEAEPSESSSMSDVEGDSSGADPSTDTGASEEPSSSAAWVVGEAGEMLRVDLQSPSDVRVHDSGTLVDLHAMVCGSEQSAWVVGSAGTVLMTEDRGTTWQSKYVATSATLRALAVSDNGVIYVVGDAGAIFVDREGDGTFDAVDAPAVDFTGVAVDADGQTAWLTSLSGTVWMHEVGQSQPSPVFTAPGRELHAIDITPDESRIVAVGDYGLWVESTDRGHSWHRSNPGTVRDLFNVEIAPDASSAVAVGEAGVVVRWTSVGPYSEELLPEKFALRALHLSGEGAVLVVGDAGFAFTSDDDGESWVPLDLGSTRALFGVDELGG